MMEKEAKSPDQQDRVFTRIGLHFTLPTIKQCGGGLVLLVCLLAYNVLAAHFGFPVLSVFAIVALMTGVTAGLFGIFVSENKNNLVFLLLLCAVSYAITYWLVV